MCNPVLQIFKNERRIDEYFMGIGNGEHFQAHCLLKMEIDGSGNVFIACNVAPKSDESGNTLAGYCSCRESSNKQSVRR